MAALKPKTEKWDGQETTALAKAFLAMDDIAEMKAFFRDLLTETEIVEFGKRFRAARALAAGVPYETIEKETGLSSRTIARVKQWYSQGKGGYRLAMQRIAPKSFAHHHRRLPRKPVCVCGGYA